MPDRREIDYRPKRSLGETDFEQQVVFAHRWATRSGTEVVNFSAVVFREACDFLRQLGRETEGRDVSAVCSEAIITLLETHGLSGVKVEVEDADSSVDDFRIKPEDITVKVTRELNFDNGQNGSV